MKEIKWYYVHVTKACFGVQTTDDIVSKVAPIGRWMMGKHIDEVRKGVERRGGSFFNMEPEEKKTKSGRVRRK